MINICNKLLIIIFLILLLEGYEILAADSFQSVNYDSTSFIPSQALPEKYHNKWIAEDKAEHFIASFIGTTFINQLSIHSGDLSGDNARSLSVGFVFTLGLVKEINDNRKSNNFFSWKDLCADILGISLAVIISAGSD
jgi:uncharacterized protein YfiM (DUF2279 family)